VLSQQYRAMTTTPSLAPRSSSLVLLLASLGACSSGGAPPRPSAPAGPAPAAPSGLARLTILSTNDFHGRLDPILLESSEHPSRTLRVGGAEALAATVEELRSQAPGATLLVDAGDFMQGSYLSNRFEGAPVRELFALLRYDAIALGNHEFDFGPVGGVEARRAPGVDLQGALKAFARGAPFPVLAANLSLEGRRPLGWPNVLPSTLIERGGVRVGIVGVLTEATATTTMPVMVSNLAFEPMSRAVEREAKDLRRRGATVVIAITHAGAECDGDPPDEGASRCRGEVIDELLARLPAGLLDAVVAGHTHRPVWMRPGGVPVEEACSQGTAVGRIELVVDRRSGRVRPAESRALPPVPVCRDVFADTLRCDGPRPASPGGPRAAAPIVPNPLLAKHAAVVQRAAAIAPRYAARLGGKDRRVLAVLARPLTHKRFAISGVGTLFASAMLAAVPGADAAVINSGAVRADLRKGEITDSDLYEALPFENRLATAKLTGREVRQMLSLFLGQNRGVPQVDGLRVRVRCEEGRSSLGEVTLAGGQPLDLDRIYTLVVPDFLLAGGDGLDELFDRVPAERKRVLPKLVRETVAENLRAGPRPLNTDERPVLSREDPPVVVEGGSCGGGDHHHRTRQIYLCR
jgi:5'-nucleotidase